MGTFNNIQFRTAYVLECPRSTVKFYDKWGVSTTWKSPYFTYAVSYDLRVLSDDNVWNKVTSEIESATISINVTHASDNDDLTITAYLGNFDLSGTYGYYIPTYAREVGTLTVTGDVDGTRQIRTPSNFEKLPIGESLYLTLVISGVGAVKCEGVAATANGSFTSIDIDSITPKSIQTEINKSKEITIRASGLGPLLDIYIEGEYLYADGTVTLTANKKTIASCKLSDGSPHTVDYGDLMTREDVFKFTCTTDWFKTIESTQDTITVTVTIEDESVFKRKATGTFEIIKPPLSLTAKKSEVTMTYGNSYESNKIYVEGSAGGVYSVTVKHGTVTETPYSEYSTAEFYVNAYKSWFQNQNFDSTNVTVTIQDELYRTAQVSFKASLPQMTVSTDKDSYESVSSGKQVSVSLDGAVGSTMISYRIGSSTTENVGNSFGLLDDLFANTRSNQLSVTIIAQSREYKQSAQTTITLTAGNGVYPSISNIQLYPLNPIAMPSSYLWVSGYSRARVAQATVTWGVAGSGNGATVVLSGVGAQVGLKTKDEKYYDGSTTSTITGAFTITITVTDSMGRRGTSSVYVSASNITTLPTITIDPSSRTVEAGESVTLGITGFVTKYDIDFKNLNTLLDSDTEQTAETYTEECAPEWFQVASITSKSMNVTVTVTDVLGRKATLSLTVTLPELRLELNPSTYVVIGNDLTIKIKGRSGQTVNMAFKATNGTAEVDLPTLTVNADQKVVTCPKTWFTQNSAFNSEKELTIQISATAGTQATTANFKLKYPDLAVRTDKSSVTAGNDITLTFDNREGERVWIDLFSGTVDLQTQYTSTNDTYRIASVSSGFFDKANVVRSQNMNVTANVRDNRSRTATVTFTLTASDSMRPTIRYVTPTIVQPSPAIDTFPNTYIASVSRVKVSVGFSLNTQAKISNATLQYSGSLPITMRVNSETGVYEATTTNPITGETDFTATLTDERGMSTSQTVKLTGVKPYSAPSVTVNSYRRCNADKTPNDSGEYCLMNVSYAITPLDNQNAKTARITSTAYTDTRDLDEYTQTVEYLFAANMERSYEITVIAIDAITQASKTVRLSTAGAIMDFLTGGKGIGLGKVAEYQNMVEVNPEWEFKCRVRVNGQLVDLGTILETLLSQS